MKRVKTNVRSARTALSRWLITGAWNVHRKWATQQIEHRFFRPWKFVDRPKHQKILAQGVEKVFVSKGHSLASWSWGEGPKVLLLHGWAGRGAQFADLITALVDAGFEAVTFDQPGHGRGRGVTNVFEFVEVSQQLEEEIGPLAGVVGHSMGCVPALVLAQQQGLRSVLFAPGMQVKEPIYNMATEQGLSVPIIRHLFERLERRYGQSLEPLNPESQLSQMSEEVLILHDQGDKYTSSADSAQVSKGLPHVSYHQTQHLGHSKILEDPDSVSRAVFFLGGEPK